MDHNQTRRGVDVTETIAACATAPGRAGVAVVRVSGPRVLEVIQAMVQKKLVPRQATHAKFYDNQKAVIDMGIAVFFQAPNSFTGEDVLELQGHGGPIIVDSLLDTLQHFGVRLARPGEFAERAFLNNKIDLTQAEAIADLIDSASKTAARSAIQSLQGVFSQQIETLKQTVINLRVRVEAMIDFPDEEVEPLAFATLGTQITQVNREIIDILQQAEQGCLLRDGISLVIIGKPNVGKSTLLNRLAKKSAAIVTDIPGTTRDVMRERILLDDIPIHIIDTAGLRESHDVIEQEGIRRAWQEVAQADHLLYVFDIEDPPDSDALSTLKPYIGQIPVTLVANKIDKVPGEMEAQLRNALPGFVVTSISAKTGAGMADFVARIKDCAGIQSEETGGFIARRRHLTALQNCVTHLQEAHTQLTSTKALECVAEELRLTQLSLSEITGEYTSDDLLGEIFSTFCIGK